ncbi:MAG: hypothetical protein NC041_07055 [Bacteroides sp.]|nr:hypothetical protein [Prevotella sp.]MCM1407055.1 hypothetical protein [Treponema brennaborense]MCM1470207.1 hypothetical protein [Bacteroides sp.]
MARQITLEKLGGKAPFADGGLKLSKSILIEQIEAHEDFRSLFKIENELLERITDSIKENSFDASQPLHIWVKKEEDGTSHNYLIDGYTRLQAAKNAGLNTVPYFEHKFENFDEAYKYALGLQVNRRNLESAELLRNVSKLLGTEFIKNTSGKKSEAIAEVLGVSPRTVAEAISVAKNADEETLAKIDSGEKSVHKAYKESKAKSKKRIDERAEDSGIEDFEDISDALEETAENPREIFVRSRDMSEQYNAPAETESDKRMIERYKDGFADGFKKGFSEGASRIYGKIISAIKDGIYNSAEEIENDEIFSDFTFSEIASKLAVPADNENILKEFNNSENEDEDFFL